MNGTRSQVPVISRIFAWSVVLEPLLFFVLFVQGTSGVTGSAARMLQVAVVATLAVRFVVAVLSGQSLGRLRVPRAAGRLHVYYVLYFSLAIVATSAGTLSTSVQNSGLTTVT